MIQLLEDDFPHLNKKFIVNLYHHIGRNLSKSLDRLLAREINGLSKYLIVESIVAVPS